LEIDGYKSEAFANLSGANLSGAIMPDGTVHD